MWSEGDRTIHYRFQFAHLATLGGKKDFKKKVPTAKLRANGALDGEAVRGRRCFSLFMFNIMSVTFSAFLSTMKYQLKKRNS